MSDPTGGLNLLLACESHATPNADELDREADALEATAHTKRVEAFWLRALSRTTMRMGEEL